MKKSLLQWTIDQGMFNYYGTKKGYLIKKIISSFY